MNENSTINEGGCRCGQLRLKIRGRPIITMACHCAGCQKMTASAFSLSALFPAAAVEISGLEPVIGGLHGDLRHHFCPYCLSWVFTRADAMGPMINVRSALLDNAAELAPFIETCTGEKLPWASTPAVHSYKGFAPMEDYPALMAEYASMPSR